MCIYITCVVLLWVCFTSHFCNVMACFREANMIQYTWIGLFSVWCGTTVWHESVWVEKCDAVYVCRNHLFFHAFTCGAHVQLFRYLETHTAQMETYFLWYACVNVCRTLIPYIHLVRFFSEVSTSTSEPGQISSFVVVVDVNFLTLFLSCSFFHTKPLSIGWHCTDFNWIFMNEWEHKHLNGHCSVEKYRIKIPGK